MRHHQGIFIVSMLLCFRATLLAQTPFIEFGRADISLGSMSGANPNYRNNATDNYFYGEYRQELRIKGVPLSWNSRYSEEPYKSGKASYFRLAYDANRSLRLNDFRADYKLGEQNLSLSKDSLAKLEGMLSYLRLKKSEGIDTPKIHLPGLPKIPTFDDSLNLRLPDSLKLPGLPELPDSLKKLSIPDRLLSIEDIEKLVNLQKFQVDSLSDVQLKLGQQLSQYQHRYYNKLLDGISKATFGLGTLSPGSMSNNSVAMNGLHVAGTWRKITYDIAGGMSFQNQLFSSQALDQLLYNQSNVFNASDFYKINSSRFIASAALGYQLKNSSIALESFYTGSPLDSILHRSPADRSIASNLVLTYTPSFIKGLKLKGSAGFSKDIPASDTATGALAPALKGEFNYAFEKVRGEFSGNYRYLGQSYNGFSQGIYLKGGTHRELRWKQQPFKNFGYDMRYAHDDYKTPDSLARNRKTDQGTLGANYHVGSKLTLFGSYTLLQLTENGVTVGNLSTNYQYGVQHRNNLKSIILTTEFTGTGATIYTTDSVQKINKLVGKTGIEFWRIRASVQGTYQSYSGLNRLYGQSYIIQPELSYKGKLAEISIAYQHLISEQFGKDDGLIGSVVFAPDEHISWTLFVRKWLIQDLTFFSDPTAKNYKSWNAQFKMTIHLNTRKK